MLNLWYYKYFRFFSLFSTCIRKKIIISPRLKITSTRTSAEAHTNQKRASARVEWLLVRWFLCMPWCIYHSSRNLASVVYHLPYHFCRAFLHPYTRRGSSVTPCILLYIPSCSACMPRSCPPLRHTLSCEIECARCCTWSALSALREWSRTSSGISVRECFGNWTCGNKDRVKSSTEAIISVSISLTPRNMKTTSTLTKRGSRLFLSYFSRISKKVMNLRAQYRALRQPHFLFPLPKGSFRIPRFTKMILIFSSHPKEN